MVRLGLNINLGDLGDRYDKVKQWAIKSNASCHLLMTVPNGGVNGVNEMLEITRWKRDLPASTRILWRTYNTLEGDWVKMLGYSSLADLYSDDIPTFTKRCEVWAQTVVGRWRNEGLQDVYRDDPANEPGLDANNVALNTRYVIRSRALVLEAKKHGFTACIGAFSVGTPHEDMIDSGVYDPLLEVVDVMSVHEYPSGCVGAGDLFEYEAMLNPKDVWQRLPQAKWAIASQYWLMRRCDRLYLRAKQVHNREIKFIISETNTSEDIPDANHVTGQLRSRYATADCGGDLRGHQAWQNYYAEMFNDHNLSQNVGRITEYMANYVFNVPHIIGVNIFQMGYRWGRGSRGLFRCHSYIEDDMAYFNDHLLPQINANIKEDTMTQPNPYTEPLPSEYEMIPAKITSLNVTNIRSNRSLTSDEIIRLEKGTELEVKISEGAMWADAGYYWRKIEFDNKIWWVAYEDGQGNKLSLVVTPIVTDVPDTPDEPDVTPSDGITQEQLDNAVQEAIAPLQAKIDLLQVNRYAINERVTALEDNLPQMMVSSLPEIIREINLHLPDHSTDIPTEWVGTLSNLARLFANLLDELVKPETVSAQNIKFPRSTADVHSIADVGFQFNPVPSMDVDEKGNITITNEPADDTNEQTLTLNGDDSEGDDDSDELPISA